MSGSLHFRKDMVNPAVRIHHERASLDAHVFSAVHVFFDPDAIGLGYLVILVAQQREGKRELALKGGLSFGAVR